MILYSRLFTITFSGCFKRFNRSSKLRFGIKKFSRCYFRISRCSFGVRQNFKKIIHNFNFNRSFIFLNYHFKNVITLCCIPTHCPLCFQNVTIYLQLPTKKSDVSMATRKACSNSSGERFHFSAAALPCHTQPAPFQFNLGNSFPQCLAIVDYGGQMLTESG